MMYHSALASLNESRAQAMALMAHELRREASIASDAGRAHKAAELAALAEIDPRHPDARATGAKYSLYKQTRVETTSRELAQIISDLDEAISALGYAEDEDA